MSKRLEPLLGSRPLFTIDRLCLEGVQQMLGERYARSTVTLTMSQAKSVMKSAYDNGRISTDPIRGMKEPKLLAGEADGKVRRSKRPGSMLAEEAPITAVAGHLGDTVETVQRVYAHWLRDDRDVPAEVLDRLLLGGSESASVAGS